MPLSQKAVHVLRGLKPEEGNELPDTFAFRSPSGHRTQRSTRSFGTSLSKAFTAYRKKAGIECPITFHGLRHGFCTTLAEAGKSGVLIQAAARHRSLSTSMRYVHLTGDVVRRELDDAFGSLSL